MMSPAIYLRTYLLRPTFDLVLFYFVNTLLFDVGNLAFLNFSFFYLVLSISFKNTTRSWRYFSLNDMFWQSLAVTLASLSYFSIIESSINGKEFIAINSTYTVLSLALRGVRRYFNNRSSIDKKSKNILIAGSQRQVDLAKSLRNQGFHIVGLIDQNDIGLEKSGFKVLGDFGDLDTILNNYHVDLVAISDEMDGKSIQTLMQSCVAHKVKIKKYSFKLEDSIWSLKDFELHELLGRDKVNVDLSNLNLELAKKTILVTGAGGSIGSEIARQIARYNIEKLLILDSCEFNLFEIKKELNQLFPKNKTIIPIMADIKDAQSLEHIFREYCPDHVYHAAAYKHVHLVEENPYSAILNNVLGTKNLISLSSRYGVDTFLLVSTDKAVNPTSIMGATKRICELLVSRKAIESHGKYCAVRFGNVLGSSGSLIPILKNQILNGGPVTITDPEMRRFFMTIPEAVSLVLKSGSISDNGAVNILKMGDEVRIVDIAKKLIKLCGHTENEIPIVFTGKKPGEKLYEELYLCGDELATEHPEIVSLPNGDSKNLFVTDESLIEFDRKIRDIIMNAIEHNPASLNLIQEMINTTNRETNENSNFRVELSQGA